MKYFRLHYFCRYVNGFNGGCIYNTDSGKMIYITDNNDKILKIAQSNQLVNEEDSFLQELVVKGYGDFYNNNVYVETTRVGGSPEISKVIYPNSVVNKVYIQVTNECNSNCEWCKNDNIIYTKTRCKKWNNVKRHISFAQWEQIFKEIKLLGGNMICFIGGNPLLEFEYFSSIIRIAYNMGFSKFLIYSNLSFLKEDIIDFLKKYNVMINVQLIKLNDDISENLYSDINAQSVFDNIKKLKENNICTIGSVLITKYNENQIPDIHDKLKKLNVDFVKEDYLYNKPENIFYSEKYTDKMYQKTFTQITKETLGFYEQYNSCIYGQMYIALSGDVTPCPMMNEYIVGNVFDNNIAKILSSDKYKQILHMTRECIKGCKNCSFRLNCSDCRAIESYATNELYGQEFCNIKEKISVG